MADEVQEIIDALEIAIATRASEYAQLSSDLALMKAKKAENSMAKNRAELAAEGRLIVFQKMQEMRDRERQKARPASPAPGGGRIDTSGRQTLETHVANPTATAAAIVAAGQRARGELPITTPEPTGIAAAVHAAADLARSGGPERAPPTGLAKAILEAGRRRRGEV